MNGRVGNDRGIGRYTFVGSRGSSVVDYVLASQSLFDYIKDFEVQDPNILSDHCCIDFSLDFSCDYENFDVEDNEQVKSKYVWNKDLKGEFLNRLHEPSIVDRLEHLNFDIAGCHGNDDIELCVSSFIDVLDEVSNPLFSKKISNFRTVIKIKRLISRGTLMNAGKNSFIFIKCYKNLGRGKLMKIG